jgi:hypothetical protein
MSITGPNIASGTTISGISGTTITLSQQSIVSYALSTTRLGTDGYNTFSSSRLQLSTSGLSVGMIVMGPSLPTNYTATITFIGIGYVVLSYDPGFFPTGTYSFYTVASYSSQTYSFAGSSTYIFRDPANDDLPFGSFPGIGTYFV